MLTRPRLRETSPTAPSARYALQRLPWVADRTRRRGVAANVVGLDNVVETGVVINLGTVVCIEANSTDESTLGWEDGELPY